MASLAVVDADHHLDELADLLGTGGVLVLSGAGLSTGSGIPDYRGPSGLARAATPMTYQAFTGSAEARQRYWARSHLGWQRIARARPNAGHRAVTALQRAGLLQGVVTQNVDGLHRAAGTSGVLELHGRLDRVVCLTCRALTPRDRLHERLAAANAGWTGTVLGERPDGDVELADPSGFTVVDCPCGGLLKPDVVFFGESVPRDRVDRAYALLAGASSLLVLGSSLKVMSGYRFVLQARRAGTPVAVVNQGPTRADGAVDLRVDAELSGTLAGVLRVLLPPPPGLRAG